ncbi:MAG: hypothetical protein J3K34DRAFT_518612 [Monoraphidium minutum]|nr:MAG: hypothetical protein J3K34DRAFT_518612 [Monoraphidium minutum]
MEAFTGTGPSPLWPFAAPDEPAAPGAPPPAGAAAGPPSAPAAPPELDNLRWAFAQQLVALVLEDQGSDGVRALRAAARGARRAADATLPKVGVIQQGGDEPCAAAIARLAAATAARPPRFPALRQLSLTLLAPADAAVLGAALPRLAAGLPALDTLEVRSETKDAPWGARAGAALARLTALLLDVRAKDLAPYVAAAARLPLLERLELRSTARGDMKSAYDAALRLGRWDRLERLALSHVGPREVEVVAGLELPRLKFLSLGRGSALGSSRLGGMLAYYVSSYSSTTTTAMQRIVKAPWFARLEQLQLIGCGLADIGDLSGCEAPALTHLWIDSCDWDDGSAASLAKLRLPALQSLSLHVKDLFMWTKRLSPGAWGALLRGLCSGAPALEGLWIEGVLRPPEGDAVAAGLAALACAPWAAQIESLDVGGNSALGAAGAAGGWQLFTTSPWPALRELRLEGSSVAAPSLELLAAAPWLAGLEGLALDASARPSGVLPGGLDALQAAGRIEWVEGPEIDAKLYSIEDAFRDWT